MIGALGGFVPLADSQTPNGCAGGAFISAPHLYPVPSGPHLVSRTGTAGRTECLVKEPNPRLTQPKECACIETAGLWPWKSASAKECVTTHRPNAGASKMDGTKRGSDTRSAFLPVSKGKRVGRCPGRGLKGERKGPRSIRRYRSWWK